MAAVVTSLSEKAPAQAPKQGRVIRNPLWVRIVFTTIALLFVASFLLLPLAAVFTEALRKGLHVYLASFSDPDALSAIKLTLITAACAVPANVLFGIAAAWCIAK